MSNSYLEKSTWKSKLIGPILSIVIFIVTYFSNAFNFAETQPLSAIPAVLFAMVILIISNNITTSLEIQKASAYSERICNAVKDNINVITLGTPESALEYIESKLSSLKEVKNTSFNIEKEIERANEKFYDTDIYSKLNQQISIYVSKGLMWKDIGDPYGIDRLREIHKNAIALAKKNKNQYRYRLIKHNEPQLNFIILEYKNGTKEVLFNWDFRKTGGDPTVLISKNNNIVEMYAVHYDNLWEKATEDHDNIAVRSTSKK